MASVARRLALQVRIAERRAAVSASRLATLELGERRQLVQGVAAAGRNHPSMAAAVAAAYQKKEILR